MFQDKEMTNDYLTGLNASLSSYAEYINESNNTELRQKLIQLRNMDESRQRIVYNYALQNGYYKTAFPANPEIVQQLKQQLLQAE